jgi:anaphase-promoting complex subunit 8
LAKSLFDCREYDRCAAVFLPDSTLSGIVAAKDPKPQSLPNISQRSLFLALYAKFMAGEKRKDEDAEMVMGPQDLGHCINKQLLTISRVLELWFAQRKGDDEEDATGQGWLEYL